MPNIANIGGTSALTQAAPVHLSAAHYTVAGNIAQNSKTTKKGMSAQVALLGDAQIKARAPATLGQLKTQAPEVYNLMMEGLATNIIIDMQHSQRHLEELWKEARAES